MVKQKVVLVQMFAYTGHNSVVGELFVAHGYFRVSGLGFRV